MKFNRAFVLVLAMVSFGAVPAAADVVVKLSPLLEENYERMNKMESRREEFFRKNRKEGVGPQFVRTTNRARFAKAEFGNERLIPDVEDFSIKALIEAMVEHDLKHAANYQDGETLLVEIEEFFASNYPVNNFRSFNNRMKGRISVVDAEGNTLRSEAFTQVLVPEFSAHRGYDGPDYAYLRESVGVRMAPVLASFLKHGIEALYPGSNIPGPVLLRE